MGVIKAIINITRSSGYYKQCLLMIDEGAGPVCGFRRQ